MAKKRKVDVALGLPSHDGTWVWETTHCIERLAQHSAGTLGVAALRRQREPVHAARNGMIKDALELGAKYVLFIDSDMTFPEDALERLIKHDVDIVSGMAVRCVPPFNICCVTTDDDFETFHSVGTLEPVPENALVEVDGAGGAFLLVKTEIFEKMSEPYFYPFRNKKGLDIGEDFYFCRKAKAEAGAQTHLDTSLHIGHVHPSIYWPKHFFQYQEAEARKKAMDEMNNKVEDKILDQIAANNARTIDQKLDKAIN